MERVKIMKYKYKLFTDSQVFHKEYSNKATLSEMVGISCQWRKDKNGKVYTGKARFKLVDKLTHYGNVYKEYRLVNTDYRFTVNEVFIS
jgi:hypothetical protein